MDVCQEETEFKWLDAAKIYEQKLESHALSGVLAGESWQRIGNCYDLASRQAKNIEEFKNSYAGYFSSANNNRIQYLYAIFYLLKNKTDICLKHLNKISSENDNIAENLKFLTSFLKNKQPNTEHPGLKPLYKLLAGINVSIDERNYLKKIDILSNKIDYGP